MISEISHTLCNINMVVTHFDFSNMNKMLCFLSYNVQCSTLTNFWNYHFVLSKRLGIMSLLRKKNWWVKYIMALTLLWLQGSKSVKMLIYMYVVLANVLSSALKSRTLSSRMYGQYIYRSKWLVKALSCIVEGRQSDSQYQSKKCPRVHICVNSQNSQLDWFWPLIATCGQLQ